MVFFLGFLQQFTVGVFLSWECPADPAISINDKNNKRSSVLFWGGEYYFVHRNPSSLFFSFFFWNFDSPTDDRFWPGLDGGRVNVGHWCQLRPIWTSDCFRLITWPHRMSVQLKRKADFCKKSPFLKKRRDLFFGEIFRRAVSNGPKSGIVIRSAANIGF